MRKKLLRLGSLILALVMCLGLLQMTALAAGVLLQVGETKSFGGPVSGGSNYKWMVDNSSIVDWSPSGAYCKVTGKKPGSTTVWMFYDIRIPYPTLDVVTGLYGTDYMTVTENTSWSVTVTEAGSTEITPEPAPDLTPSVTYGKVGEDVSGIIDDIRGFNCGVVPVRYKDLWGLADADMKLVVPFQYGDAGETNHFNEVTDSGNMVVKLSGEYYVVNTKGELVFSAPSVPGSTGYWMSVSYNTITVRRSYGKDWRWENYSLQGKLRTDTERKNLIKLEEKHYEELGDLYYWTDNNKSWYLDYTETECYFGPPTGDYLRDTPTLTIPTYGRDLHRNIQEGVLVVRDVDTDLYGLVDTKGNELYPCVYDKLYNSRGGYLSYQKGDKFGLLKNPVNPPSGEAAEPSTPTPSSADFTIENGVLTQYNGKGGAVVIPDGVTEIGYKSFYNCDELTSVTIPNGVTTIDWFVFSGCDNLTSVTIPSSVTEIGGGAFKSCYRLTSVTIPPSVTFIGKEAFWGCSALTSVTIPNGVPAIEDSTFEYCEGLSSVIIPPSVTSIGDYAFKGCDGLTGITIPSNVTSIGTGAFRMCHYLTSVTIPKSVTKIEERTFDGCTALKDVYYGGTEAQWKAVKIEANNDPLTSATIHYTGAAPSTPPAAGTAYASTQTVQVNGRPVKFQAYALRDAIGDTNYIKLRDVACVLNGTSAQFEVGWDGAVNIQPGQLYSVNGTEMSTPFSGNRSYTVSTAETKINGIPVGLNAIVLLDDDGGAYTYYKLRDLGAVLGFTVDWSQETGITITTK